MRKTSPRKKSYGFMLRNNRPNPVTYAQELIKQHTAKDALKLAENMLNSVKKSIGGGNLMEFCSGKELQRNLGFWSSVSGFIRRRQ